MSLVIQVNDLTKAYGAVEALKGISFHVAPGEIVGLLGPNGAGKSTTIKILTGYLQPDSGTAQVDGLDVLTSSQDIQARIGYLPENAPLYPDLSVQAYLSMMADLRSVRWAHKRALLSEAIYATGLEEHLTRPINQLSKGFRQRVCLAQAILHQPKLLILDEPTVGLDPTQIVEIRHLIKRLAQRSTILFSSHILSEVEAVCDRVIIIMNGEVKADAHLAELSTTADAILIVTERIVGAERALRKIPGAQKVEQIKTPEGYPGYRIQGDKAADLCPAIYEAAYNGGWPVRELRQDIPTLESVFNQLAAINIGEESEVLA
ncbi:MAG: ATP-binding cassette domain-containing protein [Chloroflexota bacterium]